MKRLDEFPEYKRVEILRNLKNDALVNFFYEYSLKMEHGERFDTDKFVAIMDAWGDIRSEILDRLVKNDATH